MGAQSPCSLCGDPGEYVALRSTAVERWSHFHSLYGLPPYGPHTPWVDSLQLTDTCPGCRGEAYFPMDFGTRYAVCPVCDGNGRRLACSREAIQAVQHIARLILQCYDQKPWYPGDTRVPIDQVFTLIADDLLRATAKHLLEQRRFTDVSRILAWQGFPDPEGAPRAECGPLGEPEVITRRSGPFSDADIISEVDRLRTLGVLDE